METTHHTAIPSAPRRWRKWLMASGAAAVLLAGGLTAGAGPRLNRDRAVRERAAAASTRPPRVSVATATRVAPDAQRVLPGNCLPLTEAAIYPRTTGYLKRWTADIGDRVTAGQLLAEIAAPEIAAQVDQARAVLDQTRANLARDKARDAYARTQLKRVARLAGQSAVSQEEYDSTRAAADVAADDIKATEAALEMDAANIRRLETLQSFQRVTAPFDGVITARNVDPGALVQADAPTATQELFHLMRTDTVRVWVNVPQTFATTVEVGQAAAVSRREDPSRTYPGAVARTADAVDPNTRTLLTEVHVPNPDDALRPGMYLQVRFTFDRKVFPVTVPAAAVVVRSQAPTVGVLDGNRAVHYRAVQLGRDYGAEVEVAVGLEPGETVVVHPGDDLPEGTAVEPVPRPTK